MPRRIAHFLWYAVLLGVAVIVTDRIFGGLIGGLKTGLTRSMPF